MRQVPVTLAWMVNAFQNSSQHSEYYLDTQTGDMKFLAPMDFPEHYEIMMKYEKQPDRFVRLPKLTPEFSTKIKQEYIGTVEDHYLKGLLEQAMPVELKYRNVLLEYEEPRRKWYKFQNDRYEQFLKEWFKEKGYELVDQPPINALEYNRGK